MDINVGNTDRALRFALGLLLIILPFVTEFALWQSGVALAISVIIGIVLVGTAAMKFCPLYRVLGINTCRI